MLSLAYAFQANSPLIIRWLLKFHGSHVEIWYLVKKKEGVVSPSDVEEFPKQTLLHVFMVRTGVHAHPNETIIEFLPLAYERQRVTGMKLGQS